MKKIIVAIDSFKGSISSSEANHAAAKGIKKVFPECEVDEISISDGGEGMLELLMTVTKGKKVKVTAHDPLNRLINTTYGISGDGKTALIEMANISGLTLLKESERTPWITTSYGTGELIAHALNHGCRNFIIGIGGSATNDCGLGMLQALGFNFLDKYGQECGTGGQIMSKVATIDNTHAMPELKKANFTVACDVNNPLYGKTGAAYVYAKQKGADKITIENLDQGLRHIAEITKKQLGKDITIPGTGAAGGMGAAFIGFLNASLKPGIQLSLDLSCFKQRAKDADIIITGEGQIDKQSIMGKVPEGVLNKTRHLHIPVIVIAGSVLDMELLNKAGFAGIFSIAHSPMSLQDSMEPVTTQSNITNSVTQICTLIKFINK
ncbi:MAG: glycerate kinase [Prolixibacteraceae bacterium]|nr:glycerate kinase [Prolixibacteraceae bacterium]